jgi:hypothetical protein
VDLSTVLLRDLLQLCSSVGLDDDALGASLGSLAEVLQAAVPSYRGLHLTIVHNAHPVSLSAFLPLHDGDSISTSLRVGFAALGAGFDGESQVVFYAATPGGFVDLAADFGYALGTPITTANTPASSADSTDGDGHNCRDRTDRDGQHGDDQHDRDRQHGHHQRDGDGHHDPVSCDGHRLIVLDADLPPATTKSALDGLEERSVINRAIGIMIDQGHHPDHAHATLCRHAAAAGVEPHIYAAPDAARLSPEGQTAIA